MTDDATAHGLGDRQVFVYLKAYEAIAHFALADGSMMEYSQPLFYFESTNCTGLAYTERAGMIIRPSITANPGYFLTDSVSKTIITQSKTPLPFQSEDFRSPSTSVSRTLAAVTVIDPVPDLLAPLYVAPAIAPAP